MHEEHVNTLFRTCIKDHGETRSLSTRAINKRWCADKGPHLPRLLNLLLPSPTTWSAETHFMPILNLVLFLCDLGCGAAVAELNNEWRLSECPTAVEKVCSTEDTARIHAHNYCGPYWMLWGGSEGLTGLWRAVKWGLHSLEMVHKTSTRNIKT